MREIIDRIEQLRNRLIDLRDENKDNSDLEMLFLSLEGDAETIYLNILEYANTN